MRLKTWHCRSLLLSKPVPSRSSSRQIKNAVCLDCMSPPRWSQQVQARTSPLLFPPLPPGDQPDICPYNPPGRERSSGEHTSLTGLGTTTMTSSPLLPLHWPETPAPLGHLPPIWAADWLASCSRVFPFPVKRLGGRGLVDLRAHSHTVTPGRGRLVMALAFMLSQDLFLVPPLL